MLGKKPARVKVDLSHHFTCLSGFLSVDTNELTGNIPSEIGYLTNLSNLELSSNPDLAGKVPTELGLLTGVKVMKFYGTRLTGTMPSEICALRNMVLTVLLADCQGSAPQIYCDPQQCCTVCS
jgi:hypothetical protein